MKNQILGLAALVAALAAIGLHFWERPAKLAYAETSVLLSEFNEAVIARKQFEDAQKEWDKDLNLLNDSLTSSVNQMKAHYDKANQAGKDSMRAALQKRNDDLQRYSGAVKKKSQDKEKELMEPVIKKMNSFLAVWGREHGYDLILGTLSGGNILQANEKINLTSRILKDLNEHYKEVLSVVESGKDTTKTDTAGKMAPLQPGSDKPKTSGK